MNPDLNLLDFSVNDCYHRVIIIIIFMLPKMYSKIERFSEKKFLTGIDSSQRIDYEKNNQTTASEAQCCWLLQIRERR